MVCLSQERQKSWKQSMVGSCDVIEVVYSCVLVVTSKVGRDDLLCMCGRDYQGRTLMVMYVGNESYKNARTLWRE